MLNWLKESAKTKTFYWNVIIGLLLVTLVTLHFLKADQVGVHYHANFQIYIHGQLVEFKGDNLYEEIGACSVVGKQTPKSRVHMHDRVSHLIHVHAEAVTYQHFFNNIGVYISDEVLEVAGQIYQDDQGGQLRFIINGRRLVTLHNKVIRNQDVLLIDFSNDDSQQLMARYQQIPQDATAANESPDPQGCLGEAQGLGFWARLRRALGF